MKILVLLLVVILLLSLGIQGLGYLADWRRRWIGKPLIFPAASRNGAFSRRARLHTAFESGGVATGRRRTKSSGADISSQGGDVKV
jgi:hypothetical protein